MTPGVDAAGGLVLAILAPVPGAVVAPGRPVPVRVQVCLACGRPSGTAGGLLDVTARLVPAGAGAEHRTSLEPAGEPGAFSGALRPPGAGGMRLTVEAVDRETGAAGRAAVAIEVREDSPSP
ncbi:hypothetical protein G3N55_09950 [Dissulfurirhabdus thermomarina]|uniref:YtkA-like domain-containing protein n=1 Tax=Dissulfurirhabdus thermomarina TaxID=1765737 RepID=A0A6N9TPG0_DISTH|nr:hypothetical protein [Dissulfurirhabdus thermomarina]NDY43161.1 hypothetical protein [Dissulfurirhabdus thermomarina]NMX23941.1 hypothetical protein [Dissulfurirhabdus thermomarina]